MPDNPILKILERAFEDNVLRHQLLVDMEGTLAKLGESLSAGQMKELSQALDESGESFASGLDQRLSQSGVSLNPQALLQQSKKKAGQQKESVEISAIGSSFGNLAVYQSRKKADFQETEIRSDILEGESSFDEDEPDYEVEHG
jgi:hypothetical protein